MLKAERLRRGGIRKQRTRTRPGTTCKDWQQRDSLLVALTLTPILLLPIVLRMSTNAGASSSSKPTQDELDIDKILNREASAFQREVEVERILKAFKLK